MPMGFSFQPGADQMLGPDGQQRNGLRVPAPDSSVKVLSFRMPKRDMRSFAPAALLNSAGSGQSLGGLSPQLLSLLLQAFSAGPQSGAQGPFSQGGGGMSSPSAAPSFPAPRVTPGDQGDRRRMPDSPSIPGLETGTEFFDRTQPSGPPMAPPPPAPMIPSWATGVSDGLDYQTYGMFR